MKTIGTLLGLIIGAALGDVRGALAGALVGLFVAFVIQAQRRKNDGMANGLPRRLALPLKKVSP